MFNLQNRGGLEIHFRIKIGGIRILVSVLWSQLSTQHIILWKLNRTQMSKKKNTESADEVEELLRAAQDETLLRLSIDTHTARGSSAQFIDPDLDRRFQTLKSRPKTSAIPNKSQKPAPTASSASDNVNGPKNVADGIGEDDLFARFTALKGSLPSYSSSAGSVNDPGRVKLENGEEEDEDDEVEKLMKWAIDAARLDPSPPSDTDDDDDDDVHDDSDEEDEDSDDGDKRKTKRK